MTRSSRRRGGDVGPARAVPGALRRMPKVEEQIEALDYENFWYPAHVLEVRKGEVLVHYDGWPSEDDEWLPFPSLRLREHRGWGTLRMPHDFQEGSLIEALDMEGKWYPAKVLHSASHSVKIHYQGWPKKWDEWIDRKSGRLRFAAPDKMMNDTRTKFVDHCDVISRYFKHDDVCALCEKPADSFHCNGECHRSFHVKCVLAAGVSPEELRPDWRCSDCRCRRFRCFSCKQWAGKDELRVCAHKVGRQRNCGKMYHPECWVASLQGFAGACDKQEHGRVTDIDASSCTDQVIAEKNGGSIARTTQARTARMPIPTDHAPKKAKTQGSILYPKAPRSESVIEKAVAPLPRWLQPAKGSRKLIDSDSGTMCARHYCATCGEAEGPAYGRSMQRCFRCCTSHHHICIGITACDVMPITHNTMLCRRCEHVGLKDLNAPDPRGSGTSLPDPLRDSVNVKNLDSTVPNLTNWADRHLKSTKLKPSGASRHGADSDSCGFQLSDEIVAAVREQRIVPCADLKPPPYMRIRRSIYLSKRREMLPISDVAPCKCSIETGGCDYRCQNRAEQQECELATCPCGDTCLNRQLTTHLENGDPPVQVFLTEKKGWGVKATRGIRQGELVMEYVGEVIDVDTWEERKAALSRHSHMYFMALNHHEIVDASRKGNVTRFINHSCSPNLSVEKWYVRREPRLGLFASMDIAEGEELSYNYAVKWFGDADVAQRCYCESRNCTGYLGKPPKRGQVH